MASASAPHRVLVVGWTEPRGSRPFFDALIIAVREDDGTLRYAGQVRSGFRDADIGRIWTRLQAHRTRQVPFEVPEFLDASWVRPRLEITVTSTGWTQAGTLARPSYASLHGNPHSGEDRRESSQPRVTDSAARSTRRD